MHFGSIWGAFLEYFSCNFEQMCDTLGTYLRQFTNFPMLFLDASWEVFRERPFETISDFGVILGTHLGGIWHHKVVLEGTN